MKIPFSVSARTAMLIGSENFSNPEGAIVELVKNAYDADISQNNIIKNVRFADCCMSRMFAGIQLSAIKLTIQ